MAPLRASTLLRDTAAVLARGGHVLVPLGFVLWLPLSLARWAYDVAPRSPGKPWGWVALYAVLAAPVLVVLTLAAVRVTSGPGARPQASRAARGRSLVWAAVAAAIPMTIGMLPVPGTAGRGVQLAAYFWARCALFVSVPAALLEPGLGGGAFDRSLALTSGARWRIAAAFFVVWLPGRLVTEALQGVGLAPPRSVGGVVASAAVHGVVWAAAAAMHLVAYRALSADERSRDLAAVFG
jgi:hypothetical protein